MEGARRSMPLRPSPGGQRQGESEPLLPVSQASGRTAERRAPAPSGATSFARRQCVLALPPPPHPRARLTAPAAAAPACRAAQWSCMPHWLCMSRWSCMLRGALVMQGRARSQLPQLCAAPVCGGRLQGAHWLRPTHMRQASPPAVRPTAASRPPNPAARSPAQSRGYQAGGGAGRCPRPAQSAPAPRPPARAG